MKTPLLVIAGAALLLSGCREDDRPAPGSDVPVALLRAMKTETHSAKPTRPQAGMTYQLNDGKSFLRLAFLTSAIVELRIYDPSAGGEGWSGGSDTRHAYPFGIENDVLIVQAPDLQVYEISPGVLTERRSGTKLVFEENPVEPPALQMKVQLRGF